VGEVVDRLRALDLFEGLTPVEAAVLATFVETVEVPQGVAILFEDEHTDELYVIESGEALVSGGNLDRPARLGPGAYFGEIALLTGSRRTARVDAATPMVVFKLTRPAYEAYLRKVAPAVDRQLSDTSARRRGDPDPA
jgi:CRP-like cAMP-binding protein